MARVRIGSTGWHPHSWAGTYYPGDIPEAWKLAYFANEFNGILLPQASWQQQVQQLPEMLEDVHEDFAVYLQLASADGDTAVLQQACQACHNHLKAILCETAAVAMASHLEPQWPLILPDRVAGAGQACWVQAPDKVVAPQVIRLPERYEPRRMRAYLEQLGEAMDYSKDILVLAEWPGLEAAQLEELKTLLELLGIA